MFAGGRHFGSTGGSFCLTTCTVSGLFLKAIWIFRVVGGQSRQRSRSRYPKQRSDSAVMVRRGERGIWQRRYWEHTIRDDRDYAAHMDS